MIHPKSPDDYQAEDDCRTLARAEEVKRDKKRHTKAKEHAAKQARVHARIAGKDVADLEQGHK
jgi:hypothetical protein